MATAPAYQALARGVARSLTSPNLSRKISGFQLFVRTLGDLRSARAASALSANDFETVVTRQYPQLKTIQGKLWGFGLRRQARMTGSGSAFFAIFESERERDRARRVLEGDRVFQGYRVFPAALVSRQGYRRLWRRQLAEHLKPSQDLWPPQSRHEK